MRRINELIWHCTATPEGRAVSRDEIDRWHKARGWRGIGYHKVVHLDGSVSEGRPEGQIGAHCKGRNTGTIGYVYVGGVDREMRPKDTRTPAQRATMLRLTREAIARYGLTAVSGHHDHAAKACPCFPARAEYAPLLQMGTGMPDHDPADLKRSRTMAGAGVATGGTMGTMVSEQAQQLSYLAPYSRVLMVMFVALTLTGIAMVIYARATDAGWVPWWRR